MGNVLSQSDSLGNVTTYGYNSLEEQVSSAEGQIVPVAGEAAAAENLPQTPGQARTYTVYLQSASSPAGSYTVTDSSGLSLPWNPEISAATPLGSGWWEAGTVTLPAGDASSMLGFSGSGLGSATELCLVQQVSADAYTPTGLVEAETNANGGVTNYTYDAVGDQVAESDPAPDPAVPGVRPVTRDVYDALGRETAVFSPLPSGEGQGEGSDTTAYTYGDFGRIVTTWQGQTVDAVSDSAAFASLPQAPGQARTYTIYVQSSAPPASSTGYRVTEDGTATLTLSFNGSASTPLGPGWYELGTVQLAAGDQSSTLTVSCPGSAGVAAVALLAQTAQDTYNADGNLISHLDALGNTTTYLYNHLGQSAQRRIDSGHPWLGPLYDKAGNTFSDTDLLGNVTDYQYNDLGDCAVTTQGLLPVIGAAYAETPSSTASTPSQPVTIDGYDADGELIAETDPLGNVTTYSYLCPCQLAVADFLSAGRAGWRGYGLRRVGGGPGAFSAAV